MSDTHTLPNTFEVLNRLIVPRGALSSPAELHGMLCGKLSGGAKLDRESWLLAAVEFLDLTDAPDAEMSTALDRLLADTTGQLQSETFALELLLPDDGAPFEQRVEALGQWCQGFLGGLGSAGIAGNRTLSAEAAEALRDFAAITQIEAEPDEDEEGEANLMEISEYVRIAVLNLYLELTGPGSAVPANGTLH